MHVGCICAAEFAVCQSGAEHAAAHKSVQAQTAAVQFLSPRIRTCMRSSSSRRSSRAKSGRSSTASTGDVWLKLATRQNMAGRLRDRLERGIRVLSSLPSPADHSAVVLVLSMQLRLLHQAACGRAF